MKNFCTYAREGAFRSSDFTFQNTLWSYPILGYFHHLQVLVVFMQSFLISSYLLSQKRSSFAAQSPIHIPWKEISSFLPAFPSFKGSIFHSKNLLRFWKNFPRFSENLQRFSQNIGLFLKPKGVSRRHANGTQTATGLHDDRKIPQKKKLLLGHQ